MDAALDTHAGRRAAHDAIDERLREWTRTRERALSDIVGLSAEEVRALEAEGVIGTRPRGL